jgi:hypothetical protein
MNTTTNERDKKRSSIMISRDAQFRRSEEQQSGKESAPSKDGKEKEKKSKIRKDKKPNANGSWFSEHQQANSVNSNVSSKSASDFVIKILLDEFKTQTKQKIEEMMKFGIVHIAFFFNRIYSSVLTQTFFQCYIVFSLTIYLSSLYTHRMKNFYCLMCLNQIPKCINLLIQWRNLPNTISVFL